MLGLTDEVVGSSIPIDLDNISINTIQQSYNSTITKTPLTTTSTIT